MSALILLGAQWGDEGKGKITDFLSEQADVVVRYQGGSNAGHTVLVEQEKFMLHLIPSGILYPDTICVIGNGVVVDMENLITELKGLQERGVNADNLKISSRAHVVLPYHKTLDRLEERIGNIGTTMRGIGPAYTDKISRQGFRIADFLEKDPRVINKFKLQLSLKNKLLQNVYGEKEFDAEELLEQIYTQIQTLKKYIADTSIIINKALLEGKNVLLEGAQGTLLDIDHGTYPFVTSSNPTAGGACIGSGIGPAFIDNVLGIVKAYTTRVGEGPFPTELDDAAGEKLREKGCEFGTTTGRARRCGWLDMVILKYAVRINGLTGLAITKLDVLDDFDTIKICVAYRYHDTIIEDFPENIATLEKCEPVYEEMAGWKQDISGIKSFDELPENAKKYIKKIEELTGVKQKLIAVGPTRSQTIVSEKLF
ncbi:MAG: adenylosuccinate synthase [Syntrophomonadaceae bacterium]|jgi:adenylosuccinate synthase|nr:adenylosuccinate synthase [Syntrophomonadaceae bacterium]